ncbi:SDR family NAD(P)-dependent oxidoreductase [Streptomyces sp. NPDC020362]|uniref:SDR family NAD(P)-dependent oxidoreductase n=1 Tax=unclassified Streptomyces TaxID=2593676 RepID=UPI000AA45880
MGKTIVITGASSGIGAAAAVELSRQGHSVLATGQTPAKLARVHRRMREAAPVGVEVPEPVRADLSSLRTVRELAATLLERCPRIDVLVNNAGVQPSSRRLSADGHELGLAVNHLAPFLLTMLLEERLRESGGRVITTSSDTHVDGRLDLDDLEMERGWSGPASYATSKLANILFTTELRRRTGLPASSFHPGAVSTDLNRDSPWFRLVKPFERFYYGRPEEGAETLVWLATGDEGGAPTAAYYEKRQPAQESATARDEKLAARLWQASEAMVEQHLAV